MRQVADGLGGTTSPCCRKPPPRGDSNRSRFFSRRSIGQNEARQIREAFAKRDRAGVAAAVTDRLCDAMALTGPAETLRARVRAYAEAGVDVCVINPIADPSAAPGIFRELSGCLDGLNIRNSGVIRATG